MKPPNEKFGGNGWKAHAWYAADISKLLQFGRQITEKWSKTH
jgi:hypothetical protein